MTNEFTREARYAVLKSADVMKCLTVSELIELRRIQAKVEEHRAEIGKPPLDCVVVESDWPEYEPTWKAIEARMTGSSEESAVQTAARILNVELIRELDDLRAKVEAMEKQKPVAIAKWTTGGVAVHLVGDVRPGDILYLAPGAKGEEK